jgi:hypothetical protein
MLFFTAWGYAQSTSCPAPAPGTYCGVTVGISPFVTGGVFGGFQSRAGTGVSAPITITFSPAVTSVSVTALDPDFPGNRMDAFDASGGLVDSELFIGDNRPGAFTTSTVTVSGAAIARVVLVPAPADFVAYNDLRFTPGGPLIRTALGSDPSSGETTEAKASGTKTAHIPLGSPFVVQLVKRESNGSITPVQATYELLSPSVQPALTLRSLFSNFVVIPFDTGATTAKHFQAVHLGNVNLRITPTDTSLAAVTLPVAVERPASLGSTRLEFDASVIDLAHSRGVPPQFLKGQMDHESNFVAMAYRYEPLSIDLDLMSVNGSNWRTIEPYSDFRLQTRDGLAEGGRLTAEDIDPRSRYSIVRNGVRRRIESTDTLVSAREIYDQNDAAQRWTAASSQRRLQRIAADPTLLNFTAQTPTAASYGMFQVVYTTAIATRWPGVNGGQLNPHYLFDTVANLAVGGGSVQVALTVLRDAFERANGGASTNPRYRNQDGLEDDFRRAFNMYNHAHTGNQPNDYGPGVILDSRAFNPRPSSNIFQ